MQRLDTGVVPQCKRFRDLSGCGFAVLWRIVLPSETGL
jgi:hypothetical protein